jgi:hypothetical protein
MTTPARCTRHDSAKTAQYEALRRELLKRIIQNEAQRRDQRKASAL